MKLSMFWIGRFTVFQLRDRKTLGEDLLNVFGIDREEPVMSGGRGSNVETGEP